MVEITCYCEQHHTMVMHLLKEAEFGIDSDLYVPIKSSGVEAINLKKGLYQYKDEPGVLKDNHGNSLKYYGYVIVDANTIIEH